MRLYGDGKSGNCLKVKWVCDYLRKPYRWIEIDTVKAETRTAEFLRLNPAGQVPTVVFDDGRALAQSNAIIRHLARGSDLYAAHIDPKNPRLTEDPVPVFAGVSGDASSGASYFSIADDGTLADVAPTLLAGLSQPLELTLVSR